MTTTSRSEMPATLALTARESDLFACVANGYTNSEAGQALGLCRITIKRYKTALCKKLDAINDADLVRIVYEARITEMVEKSRNA